jgi:hypothetical protein
MITNTLAHWLPSAADNTAVSAWNLADWEAAMWVVYWQNALPWLAQRIRETDAAVPEPVHTHLLQLEADSRERTRLMLDGCLELLTAVNQAGIQAIPFKGAALAPLYYPDPLLRPLADLDILIHEKDVKPVVHIIKQLGYRYYSRSAEDQVYLRGERQDNIWAPDNVHPVELRSEKRSVRRPCAARYPARSAAALMLDETFRSNFQPLLRVALRSCLLSLP